MMNIKKLEAGSATLGYRSSGPDSPAAILFIHGAGGDSRLFFNQLQFFKDRCRAIAVDLPAHGASAFDSMPTVDDYVASIARVLDAEGVTRVITVGHSMGGGISFELYARMRERVAGMVLISTGAVLPVSDVVFELVEKDYATFCKFLVKLSYSKNAPEMITSLALKELESMNKAFVANDFAICNRFNYRALLPTIDVPVLIIANRGDKMVPPENAEEMARGIRDSKLVLYESTGHLPYLENHAQVNDEIDGFLKKVLAKVQTA